jgi:hypothetical protein
MNAYENLQRKDTALNGGLLAVAIAWMLMAAAQGPLTSAASDAARNDRLLQASATAAHHRA